MIEELVKFFNNGWVISTLTGIFVYFITNWYGKIKENKDYRKNTNQVTNDVVIMLQEFIVEKQLPQKEVLISYYLATCEKYNVLARDTLSIVEMLEILIKEILDSQFLNGTNKLEYCNLIENYKLDMDSQVMDETSEEAEDKRKIEEDATNKLRKQLTSVLAMSTTYITMMLFFYSTDTIEIFKAFNQLFIIIFIVLILLITILFSLYLTILKKK